MTLENVETYQEVDFSSRSEEEKNDFLSMTWCNQCGEMDLGMVEPKEYVSEARHWIEGRCKVCYAEVITEIQEGDDIE
ncbi:hypothetical protein [Marinomonas algicola]|uniref:hypothetical protein n=1 Tax=Marinomonas algicola TaxID=2773454 RepID=UPI00174CF046|nr:hypothetical protein [Marinomonas algicola]